MATDFKRIVNSLLGQKSIPTNFVKTQLSIVLGKVFTVADGHKVEIMNIKAINTTGVSATIDLHFVKQGESADATNKIIPTRSITANDIYVLENLNVLDEGDTIQAKAGTVNAITIMIDGYDLGV